MPPIFGVTFNIGVETFRRMFNFCFIVRKVNSTDPLETFLLIGVRRGREWNESIGCDVCVGIRPSGRRRM